MNSLFSAKGTIQWNKIVSITIFWVVLATLQFLYEYLLLVHHNGLPTDYQFGLYLGITLGITVLGGLIGGALIVFFLEDWFRRRSYGQALLMVLLLHTALFLFVMMISYTVTYSLNLEVPIYDTRVWRAFGKDLQSVNYWKNYTFWLLIAMGTIAGLFINDKYGPGLLKEFLLGRYFQPKREERIFMFLDLRSSTAIAEELGEEQFFHFLKEVFKEVTTPIIFSRGEIYKYVGDEIIISWKMQEGTQDNNCINCFFDIQEVLLQKKDYYHSKFGIIPEFKAGLHYGYVMAGEVGVVKRDIEFSGDVLNTASRIQSKCNELGVNLLLSEILLQQLNPLSLSRQPQLIGNLELRGRNERVTLYTVG